MSYFARSPQPAPDGTPVTYHVNAGVCQECHTQMGMGTCAACVRFATAMEELAQAVTRRMEQSSEAGG